MASKKDEPVYIVKQYLFDNLLPFVEHVTCKVKDQAELLKLPWVKAFSKKHPFARYSISEKDTFKYLMVENNECTWWNIVAILPLNFPTTLCKFKSVLDKQIINEEDIKATK